MSWNLSRTWRKKLFLQSSKRVKSRKGGRNMLKMKQEGSFVNICAYSRPSHPFFSCHFCALYAALCASCSGVWLTFAWYQLYWVIFMKLLVDTWTTLTLTIIRSWSQILMDDPLCIIPYYVRCIPYCYTVRPPPITPAKDDWFAWPILDFYHRLCDKLNQIKNGWPKVWVHTVCCCLYRHLCVPA